MIPHDARLARPAAGFRSSIWARRRSYSVVESPPRHAQKAVMLCCCCSGVVSEGGHPPKNDARVSRARTRELSKGSAGPFP